MTKIQTIYWRRKFEFPVECLGAVDIVRGEKWTGPPLKEGQPTHDTGWHRIDIDMHSGAPWCDVMEALGLCGDLHECSLIADAVTVNAAILACLGIKPPRPEDPVYDCPWKPSQLDNGGTDEDPSPDYAALQCHCGCVHDDLREALAELHGIEIEPLSEF
jgi:hypothetical protein